MIDHGSVPVRDLKSAAAFYAALLSPLGMRRLREADRTVGFGKTYPEFWLNARAGLTPSPPECGAHVCLRARDVRAVEAFYAAALAGGAQSDGAPGRRPEYSPRYYAAFIRDRDGNRIEAVTFLRD
jgi:catechol 2,3-dioxygenase-like lactoylglutathione lyase family enzyme